MRESEGLVNPRAQRKQRSCSSIPRRDLPLPRERTAGPSKRHRAGWRELERACRDPKDGELCPGRLKPEETLVEDRRGSDVQIDRPTRV